MTCHTILKYGREFTTEFIQQLTGVLNIKHINGTAK